MTKLQFRVLYREFLFRMVDLAIMSAHAFGDANKLLGQFATLLILVWTLVMPWRVRLRRRQDGPTGATCIHIGRGALPDCNHDAGGGSLRRVELGSTFPDRRDVLVLATFTGARADDVLGKGGGRRHSPRSHGWVCCIAARV